MLVNGDAESGLSVAASQQQIRECPVVRDDTTCKKTRLLAITLPLRMIAVMIPRTAVTLPAVCMKGCYISGVTGTHSFPST